MPHTGKESLIYRLYETISKPKQSVEETRFSADTNTLFAAGQKSPRIHVEENIIQKDFELVLEKKGF